MAGYDTGENAMRLVANVLVKINLVTSHGDYVIKPCADLTEA